MAATGSFRQEMPPQGGYKPVDWKQRIPRALSGGRIMLGGSLIWGFFIAKKKLVERRYILDKRELMDSRVAIAPFLLAEQQRQEMTRFRENRDYENELMKDVDGWVTGTLFGEKVYVDDERCYFPGGQEFYAHNHWMFYYNNYYKRLSRF
ncbi:NADH dehydrogenase [ubiquinone] 1 alpha subcomplex subunit 13-like [Ylistrum balloti]|uniref:NADH dehydrogenase [ubiquinone] 1 alpha subcomplex subunit 13-like n=1 Tax=Ylistrum balloti TaxID=509963 RepID=UPI002905C0BC|nr:NADH dehydrogenase [ubiquinone] 1 alpha subcomplex subunit 13-like [Ylistrum balloti]